VYWIVEVIVIDYLTYYKALCFVTILFTIFLICARVGMAEVSHIGCRKVHVSAMMFV